MPSHVSASAEAMPNAAVESVASPSAPLSIGVAADATPEQMVTPYPEAHGTSTLELTGPNRFKGLAYAP